MSKAELDLVPHECPALPPRSPEPGLPLLLPVPRRHALWLPLFSQSTGSMVPAWHDQHMCDVICRDQGSHPSCGPSGLRPPERAGRLSSRATCPRGPPKCPDSHLPAFVYSPPPARGPSLQPLHSAAPSPQRARTPQGHLFLPGGAGREPLEPKGGREGVCLPGRRLVGIQVYRTGHDEPVRASAEKERGSLKAW